MTELPGPPAIDRPRLAHQPALDGLRGAAVAGVVAFHLGYLDGGFLGVDLFFTLSGYLITRLLLVERDGSGNTDLADFWKRRAWRLLPALFLVLATVAVYAWIEARPDELIGIRESGLASLLYVTNWFFLATGDGYWNLFTTPTPFDHLWSLAIEEQFYVIWPILFVPLASQAGSRALAWFSAVAAVLTAIWMAVGDPANAYLNTITRSSSILLGALLGIALHHDWASVRRYLSGPAGRLTSAASLTFVAWSWIATDGSDDASFFDGGFFIHAVSVCVLIGRVTIADNGTEARVFSLRALRALGIVSYGLYLWHWPVIVIANLERTGTDGATLLAIRLALMTLLTTASYLLIEKPARHNWSRVRHAIWGLPVAAVITALLLTAGTRAPETSTVIGATPTATATTVIENNPTKPSDNPTFDTDTADSVDGNPSEQGAGGVEQDESPPRLVVTATAPPIFDSPTADDPLVVLLVGDSYLFDAEPAIVAAFETVPEIDIRTGARWGFAITDSESLAILTELRDLHRPDVVITMWARFDAAWLDDRGNNPDAVAELEAITTEAFDLLSADGAAVVAIGLAPSLGPGIDRVPVDRTINDVFIAAADGTTGKAVYLDPDPVVAPDGEPERWIVVDGNALLVRKADVSHYCGDGAARWGLALGELLATMTSIRPVDPSTWWSGDWRDDPRFHGAHAGSCAP
jgi:peptidoglycan/LPS O-acetylase OafA/YrhL